MQVILMQIQNFRPVRKEKKTMVVKFPVAADSTKNWRTWNCPKALLFVSVRLNAFGGNFMHCVQNLTYKHTQKTHTTVESFWQTKILKMHAVVYVVTLLSDKLNKLE